MTLIEWLIALTIIGILAAILVPNIIGYPTKSCLDINQATYQQLIIHMSPEEAIEVFVSRPVDNADLRGIIGRQKFRGMEPSLCTR